MLDASNAKSIVAQGKHFSFVQSHHVFDLFQLNRLAARICFRNEFVHAGPAIRVERQADGLGMMFEHEA